MREKITINDNVYDNMSVDGKVGFQENRHKYMEVNNTSKYFKSVTGLLKDYHDPFNPRITAEKVIANPNSKYFDMSVEEVLAMWTHAAAIGTELHDYGETILNGGMAEMPDDDRAQFVIPAVEDLWGQGYELAKTELLVYSSELALAGQSDILLKKSYGEDTFYMIYDWKFLSKPLQKKSYYNRRTRKYKKMSGPFRFLDDCNWIHYSIQLALYETLTGDPSLVREKVLIVVTEKGYEFIPTYPMRVFWDSNSNLSAVYETWDGKYYDSRTDKILNTKPTDIEGL